MEMVTRSAVRVWLTGTTRHWPLHSAKRSKPTGDRLPYSTRGLIPTKWEMVEEEYEGDCIDNDGEEKRGQSKNRDPRFEELVKPYNDGLIP